MKKKAKLIYCTVGAILLISIGLDVSSEYMLDYSLQNNPEHASTYHSGIDIGNSYGTSIYASDGGTVTYSGWMSGYGYLIIIDHGNGYQTYYGHNSSLVASLGQKVHKGQLIARMGSTGRSTGNHCHFGIKLNGTFLNPLNYL